MKIHSRIILLIKIIISPLLIYWLIRNDYFSFANIKLGMSNLPLLMTFLVASFLQLILSTFRTVLLLQGERITFKHLHSVLKISWASIFVNCISPSSLFGEVFKIKALTKLNASTDNSVYTSIFSKVFSLLGLITISLFASLIFNNFSTQVKTLTYFCAACFAIFLFVLFAGNYLSRSLQPILKLLTKVSSNQFFQRRLFNFKTYIEVLLTERELSLKIFLVSLLIQILNTLSFLFIVYLLNPNVSSNPFLVVALIPIGFLAMSVPISFAGLGVGHVAFSTLLKYADIQNGADIFTIYFAFSFFFDLLGGISFVSLWRAKSAIYPDELTSNANGPA